jgi:hypothetical protein
MYYLVLLGLVGTEIDARTVRIRASYRLYGGSSHGRTGSIEPVAVARNM